MISLPPIKNTVHDSIELIERTFIYHGRVPDWSFKFEPANSVFRNQAKIVQLTAIERNLPMVWLTETHAAVDTMTNFLCHYAKVDPKNIARGYMQESDFPALCNACGIVSASKLRIGDVDSTELFREIALSMAKENEFSYVLCDWDLSKNEVAFVESLALKGNVTVCWPP